MRFFACRANRQNEQVAETILGAQALDKAWKEQIEHKKVAKDLISLPAETPQPLGPLPIQFTSCDVLKHVFE